PLISRAEEIELLVKRWEQAKDGEGHIVLLSGEPGIGKSRITQAMTGRIASEPHVRLDYQCSPYHSSSALFPMIEQLERVAGIARNDGTDAKLDKMERALKPGTSSLSEVAPLFAAMLSLPTERYPSLKLSPERQRQKTVEALVDQLVVLSQTQPVLMIFEDVHWIDPTTLETVNAMIDRIQSIPVLLVITFRPEFEPPWRGHGHWTTLTLSRLSKRDCKAMVERMTGGKQLPADVLDQIVVKTDGVPLFIEELTKTVLEAGFLRKAGDRYKLDDPLPALGIPSTLQDSLMARLDRLAPVKEVAQVGACIGREFPYDLLAAVSSLRRGELAHALTELIDSELVFERGAAPSAIYTFKHALVRDAAYMSLLKSRKREIHGRIARTLEESFPDRVETDPELIAHHCTVAGLSELAVRYWRKAGERAAARFSHEEAIKHYTHGLEIVQALPDSKKRAACEYGLLTGIVNSLRVLGRFDMALEALETAARIAARRDNPRERAEVHYLRGNMYFMQGKFEACLQEHETALHFAEQSGSVEFQARAYSGLGDAKYLRGQMISAFRYFDRTVKLAEENGFAEIEASNLHMRGLSRYYQNQISTSIDDLRRGSEATSKQSQFRSEVSARLSAATPLIELGDLEGVKETSRAGIDLARRLGARQFEPFGEIFLSMAFAAEGDRSTAITAARRASTIALESGRNFNGAWALGNLAVLTDDETERVNALRRGEEIVHAGSVGHAVLWFYRNAIEACLNNSLWEDLERYAEALADYTKTEPLAWSDFFIARGRALAAWGSGLHDDAVRNELLRLRDDAQICGHYASRHALDKALAADYPTPLS
ncbi:MAG: AAA family ATPase, partial [Betaproteobacteria bacterium]